MSIDIKVPPLPESVTDATVLAWHHQVGDRVERDDNLVDLETDKVVLEVPAPRAGVLTALFKETGSTVGASETLATIEEASAPAPPSASPPKLSSTPDAPPPPVGPAVTPAAPQKAADTPPIDPQRPPPGPAARRLLEQHAIDPAEVVGTGPKGRVTKGDVLQFIAGEQHPQPAAHHPVPRPQAPLLDAATAAVSDDVRPFSEPDPGGTELRPERRVPMTRLRRRIAERLVAAQQTAAMLTTFNEVDMSAVMALRGRYRDNFEKEHGIKLGFMSFFVKAVIQALRRFPIINASIEGDDIIYHGYFDIGIAVSTPRGLVVPILRDADRLSFAGVEQAIVDVAGRARDGKLAIDELTGGCFSITNGGIFGSLLSTPILNPPQSAILGMHKIQERPMAVEGRVEIRPMMYLALSYDHRIVDGSEAVRFLVAVKEALEDPGRLLLEL